MKTIFDGPPTKGTLDEAIKSRRKPLSAAGIGVLAAVAVALPTVSFAQSGDDPRNEGIEEIIVVARNQKETLQEAPLAVSALTEETLDVFRIDEATDLVSRIPTLNISIGGSGAGAGVNLRGIGSSFISNAFDSAVALNYDGISVSTQRLLQSAFFDVEQVAVLKGPQSLYFGKAASAGVLALTSANPTDEWETRIKVSHEFEENGNTIGGHISGPITETLGFRLAGEVQEFDKFTQIEAGNPTQDRNRGLENIIARATFHWEPLDNFTANLKVNYNEQRSEILNSNLDIFCGGDGLPDPSVLLGGAFGATPGIDLFLPTHDCNINDGQFVGPDGNALINSVPIGSPGEDRSDISQAYNNTDTLFARLQLDWAVNENFDTTLLVGYIDLDNEYNDSFNSTGANPDGSAAGLVAPFENTLEQITLEARFASSFDGPFNFQLGAFWEDRDIGHETSQNAFNPSLLGPLQPFVPFPLGPDPATGFTFDWLADRPIEAEALSFFGSINYQITNNLELSGGVRWTDEEKSTSIAFPFVHAGVVALGAVPSGFETGDIEFEDDNWSPEVVLRYLINDDISVYGAYKTGFKSGGVDNNTLPTGSVLDLTSSDVAARTAAEDLLRFESEESEGFEVGLRSQFLDRALTLNLTAYFYEFTDQQVQIFDPAVFAFSTFNAGEVETKGIELDFFWLTEAPGLSFSGSWAYLDTEITGDLFAANGQNLRGRRGSLSPKFSGNIAINWETQLSDGLNLRISPNVAYKSSYILGGASVEPFDAVTNPLGDIRQSKYATLDVNVSLFSPSESWRLSLIGTNLTNKRYLTFAGPAPFRPPGGDDQLVGLSRGGQIFLEAALRF